MENDETQADIGRVIEGARRTIDQIKSDTQEMSLQLDGRKIRQIILSKIGSFGSTVERLEREFGGDFKDNPKYRAVKDAIRAYAEYVASDYEQSQRGEE